MPADRGESRKRRQRERARDLRKVRRKLEKVQAGYDRDCADVERIRADAIQRPECRKLLAEADAKLARKGERLAELRHELAALEVR